MKNWIRTASADDENRIDHPQTLMIGISKKKPHLTRNFPLTKRPGYN